MSDCNNIRRSPEMVWVIITGIYTSSAIENVAAVLARELKVPYTEAETRAEDIHRPFHKHINLGPYNKEKAEELMNELGEAGATVQIGT